MSVCCSVARSLIALISSDICLSKCLLDTLVSCLSRFLDFGFFPAVWSGAEGGTLSPGPRFEVPTWSREITPEPPSAVPTWSPPGSLADLGRFTSLFSVVGGCWSPTWSRETAAGPSPVPAWSPPVSSADLTGSLTPFFVVSVGCCSRALTIGISSSEEPSDMASFGSLAPFFGIPSLWTSTLRWLSS